MDIFGIGPAIQAVSEVYFTSARRTGRTTHLVQTLRNGDYVVTVDEKQAHILRGLLRTTGLAVEVVVVDPARPDFSPVYLNQTGRTLFDHTWIETRYRLAQSREADYLTYQMKELSANTEALEAAQHRIWLQRPNYFV